MSRCRHRDHAAYPGIQRGGPPLSRYLAFLSDGACRAIPFSRDPVVSYTAFSPLPPIRIGGGIFSAALSVIPTPGRDPLVLRGILALESSDFPPQKWGDRPACYFKSAADEAADPINPECQSKLTSGSSFSVSGTSKNSFFS